MKTLRSMMLGLVMLAFYGAAKADTNDNGKLTQTYAVNTYVDAMTRGRLSGLNDVLDNSASFSMVRGKQVLSYGKKQMLDYFKSNRNTEQICTTSTSIVESNASIAIVKVDMKYTDFTRSNYVTIANTGNGWKITNVYSTFS
ncbi:MAG TPA: nuclear transport factor 2 family protein [Mucilaginibacter sp.]|nr:nuclear transport factor 2 family protein [Mucilaginibacter sp.]